MKDKVIAGLHWISALIFMGILCLTKLVPVKMLLLIGGLLLLLSLAVQFLTKDKAKKAKFITGAVLAGVMLVLYIVGGAYIMKGVSTLNKITEIKVERADIGVYVRKDDVAETVSDVAGRPFGVMESLDRENTDYVLSEIEAVIESVDVKEYAGIMELVDSLLETQETDVIVVNSAYLDLLEEIEGYTNVNEEIRLIHIEQVETEIEIQQEVEEDTGVPETFSVYISGIDSRSGLVAKSRNDVNIVATVNTETRQVLLVSTPRDYYVPLSISGGVPDKLTHAGIYGIDVSVDTLEMLYGTDIDYYFRVNFSGFEQIIDALGGITVVSDYAFNSKNMPGYSFVAGENQVNGEAALAFVRERYAFREGDRQRGKNQLAVIEGVIRKATSPALLTNFSEIMKSVEGSFETSVPYDMIAGVVRKQLSDGGDWNIVSYSVDGTGSSKKPYSMSQNAYVMVPNYDTVNQAISMMNQVKGGEYLVN